MPQLNSDDAANDEPTTYNVEECEDDQRWNENLNDIKGDLVDSLDRDTRGGSNNKNNSHGETSNKDRMERDDPRDEAKVTGRPYHYPPDIGSIVSSLPSFFQNGGLPPNSKVPYPYHPYHLFYGASPSADLDAKTGISHPPHPDIPAMYPLPGQLGRVPHPLAPWPTPPIYPMCTASTISPMLRYPNPFAAFTSAAAAVASNMPRFPHGPGMHPTMIPHPALVSNGTLANMGNGQHPHHGKHEQDKTSGRHSKGDSEGSRSKRDRPYVKKPLNAFMLYMKEQRAKVVAECTLKESAAINQILGRKWHSLSREEQQKYYEMARKERQLHLQMYPGWSARDNYGKRKKRKKEKNQGECTAQNPKKCRAVFGLEQQQLWCAPCRRKKKCIRYQHDDDSEDDDLSPLNSPQQYQGYQPNPFDAVRTTSPLSMTSQSINSTNSNSDFNNTAASSSTRPQSNHVSPQIPINISDNLPEVKQEYRLSPNGMDGQSSLNNGRNYDRFNGRHPGRTSSSDNSFKSEGSPHSQGGDSTGSHGNHHHGNNDNTNNNNQKELGLQRQNFNRGVSNGNPPQNIVHRQASAPPGGSEGRSNFRKTNSLDNTDVPGPSGLTGRRNSDMPAHNSSGISNGSETSPRSRTHRSSSLYNKPNGPHVPHPSPLHPQSGGIYLPSQTGTSPLLPVSPSYNHGTHGGPFIPPISPYLPAASMLAAFGAPPSPLASPMLSLFKGISPSSIGGGMGVPAPGSSHANQSRVTPGAVVEGKS